MSDPNNDAQPPTLSSSSKRLRLSDEDVEKLVMKPTGRRRLGKYVLLGRIGSGGMGKIYLAYAPGPAGIEKLLVVKRLHSHLSGDAALVQSFLDEARLSMALNHPNIVSTFDVGEVEGRTFMVMEYIDGQNLGVLLRTAKRSGVYPSSALWAGLFGGVLEGLHAAHVAKDARGRPLHIIHRDVSPQNILITYEGIPKLVDFGIAKAAMRVSETDAGVLKGKYAYMSPEQVRGEPLDARSDVFAAVIVLWEMLAGRRLYKADSVMRSVERILTEAPISPVRINAECDADIAKVAFKALQKDRALRFGSAAEMKDALDDVLQHKGHRVRTSEVKELMHGMFADVIARQRAVLHHALSDEQPALEDDEPVRPTPDSASDLSLRDLPRDRDAGENTTPSQLQRSPLVTSEREAGTATASAPPPRVPIKQDGAGAGDAAHGTRSMAAAPSSPLRSRRAALVLLALLLLGTVLGALAARVLPRTPVADAVDAGPTAVAPVAVQIPVVAAAADAGQAPLTVPTDAGASAAQEEPEPEPEARRAPRVVRRAPAERSLPAEPKPPPPLPAEAPASEVERSPDPRLATAEPEQERGTGFLSLDTVPWTTVYLGKKRLGETPLVNVPVPAGTLELTLVNSDAGIREAYIARVKPGETFRQRLDLN